MELAADKTSGPAPLTVQFDPAGTSDPDGGDLTYAWDFDGDGTTDSTEEGPVTAHLRHRRASSPRTCR